MLNEIELINKINKVNIIKKYNNSFIIKYNNLYFSLFLISDSNTFPNIFIELNNNKFIHYTYFLKLYRNKINKLCKILNDNYINYNKILDLNINSISSYYFKKNYNIYNSIPETVISINIPINRKYILNNTKSYFTFLKKIKRIELLRAFMNEYKIFYDNYNIINKLYLFYKYCIINNKPIINIINFLL